MKLLLFSDLHLDASFAWCGASGEAARRRRQALRDTLRRIVALAVEVRAEAVLCAGDLYEQDRFSPDTMAFVAQTFASLDPIRVFLAPGNHDWYGRRSLYQQVSWSPNVHLFTESRLEPVTLTAGLTLWGAAHRAPANTTGFLDGFRVDRGGCHLALFHGSERGWFTEQERGKAPHAPFSAEQIEQAGLQHAFVGHYHRPRDAARHTYPGNPDPLTFGEDGERGAVIVTLRPDGSLERERRRVAVTECHDLRLDLTGCASQQEARDRLAALLAGRRGVARVMLHGTLGRQVELRPADLASQPTTLDALTVRIGPLHPDYDFEALAQEATVRGQFVRDVLAAADLGTEQRRRVLITGLRALDGRDDLEVA